MTASSSLFLVSTPDTVPPKQESDELQGLVLEARRHIKGLDATLDKIGRIKGKPTKEDPAVKK